MIGSRLGRYEITGKLGQGGMGEVYRATDSKLHRDVAIKVLPPTFSEDPERLARFEREAQLLAQLNHPNIAAIYGLEESGGLPALVMELVEGPTLAERLAAGPVPLEEVLAIARQIADALEEAHEKGIVHRDLKPQNVKASVDGRVKVLDFGLAKAMAPIGSASPADTANSPTVTFNSTNQGVILGTAAYMAPEQARGAVVDRRADIWSFGVVLYEMLAGERLFEEGSLVDTLSAVMRKPVDMDRLPRATPLQVRDLVGRCLERDPKRRLRDVGEARLVLEAALDRRKPPPSVAAGPERTGTAPSVAVLPFVNLSADPENEYFADGITEDVIAHLAKIHFLKVISRASVMAYKSRERNPKEIGTALGAATLLEGSVRKSGNRVRIVAQLIDTQTGEHVWVDTYDRELSDIFAIQTDVALKIAGALRAQLSSGERARIRQRPTRDIEAYQLFLKGRSHLSQFTEESMRRSLTFFEQAIARDPDFALAHVNIAHVYAEYGIEGFAGMTPDEAFRQGKEAVARALDLDQSLGEAHGIAGLLRFVCDFDYQGAEREFLRAIAFSPGSADVHDHYGWLCSSLERYDDALREVRYARELDPQGTQTDIATILLRAGRNVEALEEARHTVAIEPGFSRCHSTLGWALIRTGSHAEGVAELKHAVTLSPGSTLFLAQLGQAHALVGETTEARRILEELRALATRQHVSPYHFAYVLAGLDEQDEAIDWLEQAYEQRSGAIYGIKGSFLFINLRDHPRFRALLSKMNLL